MLAVVEQHPAPVIARDHPDAASIRYGFEGGMVVRLGDTFHLFVSEMAGEPQWVKMRLSRWTSGDRIHWRRAGTLYESSGEYAGMDDRAALWSPIPIYDEDGGAWNLFYVAYRCMPSPPGRWCNNFEGKIWRAVSTVGGRDGIGGPYADVGIVLRPMPNEDPWEGLQGVDSFFPYRVGGRWLAFYGSAQTQQWPAAFWGVGLAEAGSLSGPWKRLSGLNPVLLHERFTENPIVTRFADGTYGCVSDPGDLGRGFGFAESPDGVRWGKTALVELREDGWLAKSRTPFGLTPRDDGFFDVFFVGKTKDNFGAIGWATVRRE